METKKVKVGIVLGGHAVQDHLAHLLKMPEVEIVGAHGHSWMIDQANKDLGIKLEEYPYGSLCGSCDAIIICSPYKIHYQELMIATHKINNCNVLVEQPILTDESEVEKFKKLLWGNRFKSKVITTCFPRRFDAMYVRIKKLVEEYKEEYGEVEAFEILIKRQIPSEDERKNYRDSLLSDQFYHDFDYLNFVLGCQNIRTNTVRDSYDSYYVHGWRSDDVRFVFDVSRKLPKGSPSYEKVTVRFKRAVLEFDNLNGGYLRDRYKQRWAPYDEVYIHTPLPPKKIKLPKIDHDAMYKALNRNFIDSILGKAEPYMSMEEMIAAATVPLEVMRNK